MVYVLELGSWEHFIVHCPLGAQSGSSGQVRQPRVAGNLGGGSTGRSLTVNEDSSALTQKKTVYEILELSGGSGHFVGLEEASGPRRVIILCKGFDETAQVTHYWEIIL